MNQLERMLGGMLEPDGSARGSVRARADAVLRPTGALSRLDEIAVWLAGWQRTSSPSVQRPSTVVFAADHGVALAGISAYPPETTKGMLAALEAGVATANVMSRAVGATFSIVDVGVGQPTGDIRTEAALTLERFAACVDAGVDAVRRAHEGGTDLLVLGEMGIANTTAAAAVCLALFGGEADDWTGRGTGIDDFTLAFKLRTVAAAGGRARGLAPIDILREAGGAELVSIAAAVAEARRRSIPVVLDGFVVGAAVAPLHVANARALDHCVAGHRSGEQGHRLLLERLAMAPLVDLGLRLGEASGALLAVPLIRLAAAAVTDVATFQERGPA